MEVNVESILIVHFVNHIASSISEQSSEQGSESKATEQSSPWTSIVKSMDELLRYHHWKSDRRDVNESTVLRVVTRRPDTRLSLLSARPRILAR